MNPLKSAGYKATCAGYKATCAGYKATCAGYKATCAGYKATYAGYKATYAGYKAIRIYCACDTEYDFFLQSSDCSSHSQLKSCTQS